MHDQRLKRIAFLRSPPVMSKNCTCTKGTIADSKRPVAAPHDCAAAAANERLMFKPRPYNRNTCNIFT